MKVSRRHVYSPKLRGHALEVYGQIMARERRSLIVGPERRDWILERYPPDALPSPILPIPEKEDG